MPKKPDREIRSIVFPKKGSVYPNIERIAGKQEEQDLAIANKLIKTLEKNGMGIYKNLRIGSNTTDDIVCQDEDGRIIEIQVTGPTDDNIRLLRQMRESYINAIRFELLELQKVFSGCRVTIVDSGEPPYFPAVNSNDGPRIIKELIGTLTDLSSRIDTLEVGKIRSRKMHIGPYKKEIGVIIERLFPYKQNITGELHWTGSLPIYGGMGPKLILSNIVSKKAKKYAKPKAEFWLVIYTTDILLTSDSRDIKKTQEILANKQHNFDVVWYLYPHANREEAFVQKLWPLN